MPNYNYVADMTFRPFSFDEMIKPWLMYGAAAKEAENEYLEYQKNANVFKYLEQVAEENPDSRAAKIYKGYAEDMNKAFSDFSKNGLNIGNRRALMNLKRRYQGEIGQLEAADKALQKERDFRLQMRAKDPSMLYASEPTIDDFLGNKTPNLYNVSGNELYARGVTAGKTASSRVYSAEDEGGTLGNYYRKWVERNGYSKESMDAFRANAAAIPELQQVVEDILTERGVNENLTGVNKEKARQSVINGIIDGAIYQESVKPIRDAGKMSAAERASDDRARRSLQLQEDRLNYEKATSGIKINEDGTVTYDPTRDAAYQRMKRLAEEGSLGGYKLNPATGKYVKDTEAKDADERQKALLHKDNQGIHLANNSGFDITFGNDRVHYNYVGGVSNHGGKWKHGALGDDVPTRGWGFTSSSNVMSPWGNFSAKDSDSKDKMRILSPTELTQVLSDPELSQAISEQLESQGYASLSTIQKVMDAHKREAEAGLYTVDDAVKELSNEGFVFPTDMQLVEVPNESDSNKKGYLIAVQ